MKSISLILICIATSIFTPPRSLLAMNHTMTLAGWNSARKPKKPEKLDTISLSWAHSLIKF